MELVEKYFGDGSQSSIEARVYLEDYMERVREFFVEELVASSDARGSLMDKMRSLNYSAALIEKKMSSYERKRAMFVGRAIYGRSYTEMAQEFGVSASRVASIVTEEVTRLRACLVRGKFAKSLTDKSVFSIFAIAFSEKDEWSDWLAVRKKRDFMYV